jgi:uncharacterized protein
VIRGVLSGVFWGVVAVGLVASVVSLLRPLPQGPAPIEPPAGQSAPAAAPVAAPTPTPTPAPTEAVPPLPQPATPEPAAASPVTPDPAPQVAGVPSLGGGAPPVAADGLPVPAGAGDPATVSPQVAGAPGIAAPDAGAVAAPEPAMPPAVATPAETGAPAPVPQALPAAPGTDLPAPPVAAAAPPALAQTEAAPALPGGLSPAPQPEPAPEPAPAPPPEPAPGSVVQPAPEPAAPPRTAPDPAPGLATARPQPGLGTVVEGVRTDRLPRIGADQGPVADAAPPPARALDRNARPFDNAAAKPPFAILLLDDPASTVDLAALAQGDLALTLVIDPTAPGAADRAALWREAGQEVALLTNALPERGRQSDYEVALESLMSAFPQALAFVDAATGGLQGDRTAAAALVPGLAARGLGLVTWDRGLNAADQVARREGLPAAVIFRDLDAGDEAAPVIRRYLDRAAFKAQQDGRAMVLGRLRPETVAALAESAAPSRPATSAMRHEKPHSRRKAPLSYHASTRTVRLPTTLVWSGAKIDECGVWLKSIETLGSGS